MKITLNIEIDNPAELLPIATALATVQSVIDTQPSNSHSEPVGELPTPQVCPSIPKPKKASQKASEKVNNSSFDREALEIEAKELGITFRSDIKDSTLAQRIKTYKEKNPTPSNSNSNSKLDNKPIVLGEDEAKDELRELIRAKAKEKGEEKEKEEKKPQEELQEEEKEEPETPKEEEFNNIPEEVVEEVKDDPLKAALGKRKRAIQSNKLKRVKKIAWE